jgi:hypothetical protein
MPIPCWLIASFWGLAVVVSGLLGIYCFEVHFVDEGKYPRAARIQQRWFNFLGSIFGWGALWCLVRRFWPVWSLSSSSGQPTFSDFGLAFVAFVGISGYLPYAVDGAIKVLHTIALEALKKLGVKVTGTE